MPSTARIAARAGSFVTAGLDGSIDPLAAGLALAGIYWAERGAPGRGVVALVLGLSLQYRLWYLWPLVIALAFEHRRKISRWQLAAAGVVAAASLVTFGLSVPYVSKFHASRNVRPNPLVLTHGVHAVEAAALVVGCLIVGIALRNDHPVTAACIAPSLLLVFAVDQWEVWYPVLFVPLLVVPRARPAQSR